MFQIAGEIPHDSRYYTVYIWIFYMGFTIHGGPFRPLVSHMNSNICTSPPAQKKTPLQLHLPRHSSLQTQITIWEKEP